MAIKMTFSLDEKTAASLRRAADTLGKPKSEVIREAIAEYSERLGRLGEAERRRMLATFDELLPLIPGRPVTEVDRELEAVHRARRSGGRSGR